jgi:para-aminobenzoate synthetase component 1
METAVKNMNLLGKKKTPFFFLIDFEMKRPLVIPLNEIDNSIIKFNFNHLCHKHNKSNKIKLNSQPVDLDEYKRAFEKVKKHLHAGDSYLLNLTFQTLIETELTIDEIYNLAQAKYKLQFGNDFVCFSPETFIKITDNRIFSFPMKGTIDAAIPDAENIILNDYKETAEHNTIIDLIRNDLSIIAKEVRLTKYRFIDKITTSNKTLLQVSSEISGKLDGNWNENIGDILKKLLPAGSISGAPKKRTVEIIKDAENYERGYYTGIFGIYDGQDLDSAVAIRFIENSGGKLYYKSGGGITVNSEVTSEYNELQDKIYVPVN